MEHKPAEGHQADGVPWLSQLSMRQLGQRGACGAILFLADMTPAPGGQWVTWGKTRRVSVDSGLCMVRTQSLCSALTCNKETKRGKGR